MPGKTQSPVGETPAELKQLLWAPTRPCWADTERRNLSLPHRNPKSGFGNSSGETLQLERMPCLSWRWEEAGSTKPGKGTCPQENRHTLTCTRTHTCAPAHVCTCAHMHIHVSTYTCTYTHKHSSKKFIREKCKS